MVGPKAADIKNRLKRRRNSGKEEKYHPLPKGLTRRLDTLQAAVLRVKLMYLEKWNAARRWQAELDPRLLAGTALVLPGEAVGAQSVWHLYVIRTEYRDKLKEYLASRGIAAGIHYPVPIHLQPAYKNLGYKRGSFPVTEQYAQRILSLPMYAELTPELIEYVSKTILTFLSANQDSHAFYEQLVRHATPSSL